MTQLTEKDEIIKIAEKIKQNKVSEENKLKVLVYGTDILQYKDQGTGLAFRSGTYNIYFHHLSNSESPEFTNFDIIIINAGIFFHSSWTLVYRSELLKRKKQTNEFLKNKHSTACFLIPVAKNPIAQLLDKHKYNNLVQNDLVVDFLFRNNIYLAKLPNPIDEIKINRGEFKEFIDKYVMADTYIHTDSIPKYQILCSTMALGNKEYILGLGINSKILVLPYHITSRDSTNVKKFYETLTNCVLSYKSKIYLEPPRWLSNYKFDQENRLINLRNVLIDGLASLNEEIENFLVYKRALFLGDDELKDAVRKVFYNGFNLNVRDVEEVKEDLSIVNETGQPLLLIEVKGLNGNVRRRDVNQLDTHREKNNLNESFPALLIANTFMNSNSIESKNQEIHPDIIKKAKQDKIIMMRTLDLLNVLNLQFSEKISSSEFLSILTSDNYGWLQVKDNKIEIK